MTISIKLKPGDRAERAITRLKNAVIKEGLYKELKDRRYYAKPSKKKRLKREEAAQQEAWQKKRAESAGLGALRAILGCVAWLHR